MLDQLVVELPSALIRREKLETPVRRLQAVPADDHRARLLRIVEADEDVGEAHDGAGALAVGAPNGLGHGVVRAMREAVAVERQQWRPRPFGRACRVSRFSAFLLRTITALRAPDRDAVGRVPKLDPDRGVIAGALLSAHVQVDADVLKSLRQSGTDEDVVDAKAAVALPTVELVIPEREHRLVRAKRANGVGPTLGQEPPVRGAAFGLQQGVAVTGLRLVDVAICRHDVEIAHERNWRAGGVELGRVGDQTLHPGELVIELGTGVRVSVRRIKRGDKDAIYGRFQVAALRIGRVSGQFRAGDDGSCARQDRHHVPALLRLAMPPRIRSHGELSRGTRSPPP